METVRLKAGFSQSTFQNSFFCFHWVIEWPCWLQMGSFLIMFALRDLDKGHLVTFWGGRCKKRILFATFSTETTSCGKNLKLKILQCIFFVSLFGKRVGGLITVNTVLLSLSGLSKYWDKKALLWVRNGPLTLTLDSIDHRTSSQWFPDFCGPSCHKSYLFTVSQDSQIEFYPGMY